MNNAFLPETAVPGFEKYGIGHILWLLAAFVIVAAMCFVYQRAGKKRKIRLKICIAATGVLMQISRGAILLTRGEYGPSQLPLHLCSISVYLCLIYALYPKRLLGQMLFAFSLPGWILALLFPGWRNYSLYDAVCILSFLLHIVPVAFVMMQISAGELKPEIGLLPAAFALMLIIAIPIYIIDINSDLNFMFLNYPPAGTPLSLFSFLGRPGYILGMLPIAMLIWFVMYWTELKNRK